MPLKGVRKYSIGNFVDAPNSIPTIRQSDATKAAFSAMWLSRREALDVMPSIITDVSPVVTSILKYKMDHTSHRTNYHCGDSVDISPLVLTGPLIYFALTAYYRGINPCIPAGEVTLTYLTVLSTVAKVEHFSGHLE
jgi:hypothetical protein